jgi:hypothetical protein
MMSNEIWNIGVMGYWGICGEERRKEKRRGQAKISKESSWKKDETTLSTHGRSCMGGADR